MTAPSLRQLGSGSPRQRMIVIVLATLAGVGLIWSGSHGAKPAVGEAPAATPATTTQTPLSATTTSTTGPTSEPTSAAEPSLGVRLNDSTARARSAGPDTTSMLLQTVGYMVVLLVLGGVAIFVLRRFAPKLRLGAPRQIVVKETTYLGPRKSLHLVEVAGRRLLLGSTRDRIDLIADVTGGEFRLPEDPPTPGAAQ